MAVDKPTISMDADLREQADRLARAEGMSFSAFVSSAVSDAVHRRRASKALLAAVADWEGEHGVITDAEMQTAARELGLELPGRKPAQRSGNAPTRATGVKLGGAESAVRSPARRAAGSLKPTNRSPSSKSKKK